MSGAGLLAMLAQAKPTRIVGAHPGCDWVITDPKASGVHLAVLAHQSGFLLVDMGRFQKVAAIKQIIGFSQNLVIVTLVKVPFPVEYLKSIKPVKILQNTFTAMTRILILAHCSAVS